MKNTSALRPLVAALDGLSTTAPDVRDSVLDCASPLALSGGVDDVARPGKSARGLAQSKTSRIFAALALLALSTLLDQPSRAFAQATGFAVDPFVVAGGGGVSTGGGFTIEGTAG